MIWVWIGFFYCECPAHRKEVSLTNHGWGVDLLKAERYIKSAWLNNKTPVLKTAESGWHYARSARCKSPTYTCYFEDVPCSGTPDTPVFVLRKSIVPDVSARVAAIDLKTPCAILHVRRSDVLLNYGWQNTSARPLYRYISVKEYMERGRAALQQLEIKTVFVATDSSAVIDEVKEQNHSWAYTWINRPRFKSTEGGWENHFPSQDPFEEVMHILTIRALTPICDVWLGTRSSFARYMTRPPFNGQILLVNNRN